MRLGRRKSPAESDERTPATVDPSVEGPPATVRTGATDVTPVETLMTSERARAVRFPVSTPNGYAFRFVEEYVAVTAQALDEWEDACHARDLAVHALQREVDLQRHDNAALRAQIEVFRVQGDPLVNADGTYRRESQVRDASPSQPDDEQVTALTSQVDALTAHVDALTQHLAAAQAHAAEQETAAADARRQVEAVREALADAETLVAQYVDAVSERDALIAHLQTLLTRPVPAPVGGQVTGPDGPRDPNSPTLTGHDADPADLSGGYGADLTADGDSGGGVIAAAHGSPLPTRHLPGGHTGAPAEPPGASARSTGDPLPRATGPAAGVDPLTTWVPDVADSAGLGLAPVRAPDLIPLDVWAPELASAFAPAESADDPSAPDGPAPTPFTPRFRHQP